MAMLVKIWEGLYIVVHVEHTFGLCRETHQLKVEQPQICCTIDRAEGVFRPPRGVFLFSYIDPRMD